MNKRQRMEHQPELIRSTFPKVRKYFKNGAWEYHIDARSEKFGIHIQTSRSTKKEALAYADSIAEQCKLGESITREETRQFVFYRGEFKKYGVSIDRVLQEKLDRLQTGEDEGVKDIVITNDALTEYEHYETSGEVKTLRPRTIREIKGTVRAIRSEWGDLPLQKITEPLIRTFIESKRSKNNGPATKRTKYSWKVKLSAFFNWCKMKEYLKVNRCDKIEYQPEKREIQTLTIDEARAILKICETEPKYTKLVNYFAIGMFAGVRPTEISRLTWDDISLQGKHPEIKVTKGDAKTTRPRQITIQPNLLKFLERYNKYPIYPKNFYKLSAEVRAKVGYATMKNSGKQWETDAMRHTFATAHLVTFRNYDALAIDMGSAVATLKEHYVTSMPVETALEYWSIVPQPLPPDKYHIDDFSPETNEEVANSPARLKRSDLQKNWRRYRSELKAKEQSALPKTDEQQSSRHSKHRA